MHSTIPLALALLTAVAFLAGLHWYRVRLVRAQRRFCGLMEETAIAYHDVDRSGVVRRINPAACELLGRSPAEVLGHYVWELREAAEPAKEQAELAALLESRQPLEPCRGEYFRPNGERILVNRYENLLRDHSGRVIGLRAALVDITRQERDAENLRESEERFRVMADSAPVMIWMSDRDGRTEYVSRQGLEFAGRQPDSASGDPWLAQVHPMDLGEVERARHSALVTRVPYTLEYRSRRADGRYRWMLENAAPRLTASGRLEGLIGCARDNTERKQAETARQESEERFRLLMDGVHDYAIFMLDLDGRVISWNLGAERILGYAAAEILSQPVSVFYPLEEAEAGQPRMTLGKAAAEGRVEEEGWRRRKDGSQFWAGVFVGALDSEETDLRGFACVIRDITERRNAEQQLRLLESVVVNATEGVLVVTPVGGAGHTVFRPLYVNEALQRITGFQRGEVMAGGIELLGEAATRPIAQAYRTLEPASAEFLSTRRDGGQIWLDMDVVPVRPPNGQDLHLTAFLCDISQRKAAEEKIQSSAAQLETKNRELEDALALAREATELKSRFLANMSHEIRTPMNAVMGMLDLLAHTGLSEVQREYVDTVQASAGSLVVLINDILDLSRIESGRLDLEVQPFSPRRVVEDLLAVHEVQARKKGLSLRCHLESTVPETVIGDPLRFRQILTNLVGNSVKFTERGSVEVKLHAQALSGGQVRLRGDVSDTGVGIQPEQLAHVFERFRQGDSSTTRRFGGSGLGLAVARQLVELMQGEMGVNSQVGLGSHFWFTVRLAAAADPGQAGPAELLAPERSAGMPQVVAPPPPPPASPRLERILLVDDNPVNQTVARRILEREGYAPLVVANGLEALAAASEQCFDLILMDVQMPEMDGLEATTRIRRAEYGSRHTPIVAMTANAMNGDRERCLAAGMDDYIAKPLTLKALTDIVRKWSGQEVPALEA